MPEEVVDARYLEPPEPFVLTMEAIDRMDLDPAIDCVRLLLFREPFPLYKVLDQHAYPRTTTQEDDGTFVIVIGRRGGNGERPPA